MAFLSLDESSIGTYEVVSSGTKPKIASAIGDAAGIGILMSWTGNSTAAPDHYQIGDIDGNGHYGIIFADSDRYNAAAGVTSSMFYSPTNGLCTYFLSIEFDIRVKPDDLYHVSASGNVVAVGGDAYNGFKVYWSTSDGQRTWTFHQLFELEADTWYHIKLVRTTYNSTQSWDVYKNGELVAESLTQSFSTGQPSFVSRSLCTNSSMTYGTAGTKIDVANFELSLIPDLVEQRPLISATAGTYSDGELPVTATVDTDARTTSSTVQWYDADGEMGASDTVSIAAEGVYSVIATDSNGYVNVKEVRIDWDYITIPPTPETDLPEFAGDPVPVGWWTFGRDDALAYRVGLATVQSQYAASPRILSLADLYWSTLNPADGVNLMLTSMIDPQTAEGAGLDVWGRIVGIRRSLVPTDGSYLAYDPSPNENSDGDTWDNAPFNPVTGSGLAPDAVFRTYVYVKAMLNIGNGSLASLNYYFSRLYPDSGVKVVHPGTMMIRILDYEERLTAADIYVLKSLDWVPAGVGWQLWQGDPTCFGFLGSELYPFDQAPFMPDDALTIYS